MLQSMFLKSVLLYALTISFFYLLTIDASGQDNTISKDVQYMLRNEVKINRTLEVLSDREMINGTYVILLKDNTLAGLHSKLNYKDNSNLSFYSKFLERTNTMLMNKYEDKYESLENIEVSNVFVENSLRTLSNGIEVDGKHEILFKSSSLNNLYNAFSSYNQIDSMSHMALINYSKLLEEIQKISIIENKSIKVKFKSQPNSGAIIRFETPDSRANEDNPRYGNGRTNESFAEMGICLYYVWTERNDSATSDKNRLEEITQDNDLIIIQEE